MATYIVLASFTDQGIRNVKDTIKRADADGSDQESGRDDEEHPLDRWEVRCRHRPSMRPTTSR